MNCTGWFAYPASEESALEEELVSGLRGEPRPRTEAHRHDWFIMAGMKGCPAVQDLALLHIGQRRDGEGNPAGCASFCAAVGPVGQCIVQLQEVRTVLRPECHFGAAALQGNRLRPLFRRIA